MGIIPQDAQVESDVDSFVRYAKRQGGRRIVLVKGRDRTLTLRPGVTSRFDTLVLRNLTKETWDRISAGLAGEEPEILTGDGWIPDEQSTPRQA